MTPSAPPPPSWTHYVRYDQPGKWLTRALCGALVHRRFHTIEPTCPACARLQAERDAARV